MAKANVAKKPAAKAAAKPAASKSTAVVKWDEALAARAAIAKKAESSVSMGNFISLKSGVMSYQGNAMPDNQLDAIVLSSVLENNFFEGKYSPDKAASPVCYAFGTDEADMRPHPKSANPQNDKCGIAGQPGCCPNNEWDTGENGSGKACKNVRRVGLISASVVEGKFDADAIKDTPVVFLKTPVTSVKAFASFVNGCAAQNKPPLAYVTTVKATPDVKTQFKVSFHAKSEIKNEFLGAIFAKADELDKTIDFPYAPPPVNTAPPARGAAKGKGKAAPAAGRRKF